ncbi:MAG: recombination protein O N-terminal domain-containing protein [Bacteroidia bacterium]|nr:recombination protein O N-terminal domain-containing protein [Bacteroidia bacterium]MCX7651580.1 recombination protein O N-terminal domain-containing protein [Bacteroidia bacterium]MDW8417244.1 recombination protein O N-terminal domain-containing protein [Bacteroidia bacterium]
MSYEVKTRGIVLRRYPFREKSWILRLYTESEGTLSVLASGRKQAVALPGALVHVTLRIRPHREIQRLVEMDWDYIYGHFFHDLERTPYLLLAIEWLSQCLRAPEGDLFQWLRNQLIALDKASEPREAILRMLADLLGRLGGMPPSPPYTFSKVEEAYQHAFPEWKPISSHSLITFAGL